MMKKLAIRFSAALSAFVSPEKRWAIHPIPKDGVALVTVNLDWLTSSQRRDYVNAIKQQLMAAKESSVPMARLIIAPLVPGSDGFSISSLGDAELAELGLQRIPSQGGH